MRLSCVLALGLVLCHAHAQAEDGDRAQQVFVRPAAAAPRTAPPDALQWERRLRPAGAWAPLPPRSIDAALVDAARAGDDERVRTLLKRGAAIDSLGDDGFTALGAAAFAGRRSTVRLLVRAGADVARLGASGQTALHLASLAGQRDVLAELLRLHVDIEMLNRQRESALDVAASAGQQPAMDLLLQAGADTQLAGRR